MQLGDESSVAAKRLDNPGQRSKTGNTSMTHRIWALLSTVAGASLVAGAAFAADQAEAPPPAAPPAAAAPAAPAAPTATALPSMGATLSGNTNPLNVDAGPLGKLYIGGAVTGLAFVQGNAVPGDHNSWADLSNGQVFVQKADGLFQFFVEVGDYSLPALGTAYVKSSSQVPNTFGVVPLAYAKLSPAPWFNIIAGKIPA